MSPPYFSDSGPSKSYRTPRSTLRSATTPYPQKAPDPKTPYDYIGAVLSGHVSIVGVPDSRQLAAFTKQAVANVPSPAAFVDEAVAAKIQRDVFPKIRHVLYIIRENRTYDQVFGDLGTGNGDPKLTIFGREVTPNAHALARKLWDACARTRQGEALAGTDARQATENFIAGLLPEDGR